MDSRMSRFVRLILFLCFIAYGQPSGASDMRDIRFDLGKDINQTAKASGADGYSVQNVDGLLMYDANDLSPNVLARYKRSGYEISFSPLSSLTLYADKKSSRGMAVQTVALQASTRKIKSHAAARALVGGLILQFQNGRWERYIEKYCPAVTGRSSILDEMGQIAQIDACALDPSYRLSDEEWKQLMMSTQNYQWIGDGVLAKLTVTYNEFGRGLQYAIDLDFDDFEQKKNRDEAETRRQLAEGDAQGWKSTEKHREYLAATKKRLAILEKKAIERGDKVIARR